MDEKNRFEKFEKNKNAIIDCIYHMCNSRMNEAESKIMIEALLNQYVIENNKMMCFCANED